MVIIEIIPVLDEGGGERFVTDLCNGLSEKNTVILIVLFPLEKYAPLRNELNKNIRIYSLNKKLGLDLSCMFKLHKLIKRINPDIVHTHLNAIVYSLIPFVCLRKPKYFHTIHNDAAKEAGTNINKWIRKFAINSQKVNAITISKESKCSFTSFYRVDSTLIENGRPPYEFQTETNEVQSELYNVKTNKNATIIVNVARIQPQKNQVNLAHAINRLNNMGQNIEAVIIGPIGDKNMANEIKSLKSPYIHTIGVRKNPRDYMRVADAFCLSSIYEGMPITLIECFSVGAIPICTPVGGIVNMIEDGVNGILSKGTSQEDIEEALIRFMSMSNNDIKEMRYRSWQSFAKYNMKNCTKKYLECFNAALNK